MTDPDGSLGERVAIVERDIKHIVSGVARIEDGMIGIRDELGGRITETKAELKVDMGDLKTDIVGIRDELGGRINETRAELKADMGDLKTDISNLRTELKEDSKRTTDILETAMAHSKTALYTVCGTVIAAVAAALVKGSFF
ncbi:MAG: hypothetical protein F4X98_12570 [Gammaproteobacteria bacterium]|nr:hypothetical protein [Gammaproteobacteria bacterium]